MYGSTPRVLLISNSVTTTPGGPDIKYALCWGGNRQHSKTQDHMWEPEEHVQIDRGEKQCEEERGVRTVQRSGYPNWPLSSHLPKYVLVVTKVP
jgi:hypothetical protein